MPVINPSGQTGTDAAGGADFGPCADWPIQWTCTLTADSAPVTGIAVAAASEILDGLSGRRFGLCNVTLRPCRTECLDGRMYDDYLPFNGSLWPDGYGWSGSWWLDQVCGSCTAGCSCAEVSEFRLPSPVHQILEIKLDGTPMVTGAYRVDNNRLVVRTDGQRWPRCNNLNLADTEPGTWSVTATFGEPVPDAGKLAMGELACEITKAARGQDCRLPPGVTQLVRQGVTIQYPDVGQLLKDGRTGLYLVDLFLSAYNPHGLKQRSRFYSVDKPTVRRAGTS